VCARVVQSHQRLAKTSGSSHQHPSLRDHDSIFLRAANEKRQHTRQGPSKQPRISAKEPYISAKKPYYISAQKAQLHFCKKALHSTKEALYFCRGFHLILNFWGGGVDGKTFRGKTFQGKTFRACYVLCVGVIVYVFV